MVAPTATKWLFTSSSRLPHYTKHVSTNIVAKYLSYGDKLFHLGFKNSKYVKKYSYTNLAVTEFCKRLNSMEITDTGYWALNIQKHLAADGWYPTYIYIYIEILGETMKRCCSTNTFFPIISGTHKGIYSVEWVKDGTPD